MSRSTPIGLAAALALAACRPVEPTTVPSSEVQRQSELGVEYLAVRDQEKAAAAELAKAEQAQERAQVQLDAYERRAHAAAAEAYLYAAALAEAQELGDDCQVEAERLVEMHALLRRFVAEPSRDAAIEALERCRGAVARARKQALERSQVEEREAFARSVEQAFDDAYPDARGRLVAGVKAATLRVELREWMEWRKRDYQRAVDEWCATTPPFTAIELHGPQGTSRCKPAMTPREQVAAQVRAEGLVESWLPAASGTSATPEASPADPGAQGRLRVALDRATQWVQASDAAHTFAHEDTRAIAAKLQGLDDDFDVEANHRNKLTERRYKRIIIASIPVSLAGLAFSLVGIFSLLARDNIVDGTREYATPHAREVALKRTTRNAIVGYAVGVPLIAAGLTMALVATQRLKHVQRLTFSAGGIGFRF